MATNYTMQVHTIRKSETTTDGTLILEVDGKLSAAAKREIRAQIERGDVQVRESIRTIA